MRDALLGLPYTPPPPHTHTRALAALLPTRPLPSSVPLGSGGSPGPQAGQPPQSPPEVRQHIRPRDWNGKGGHLARLVSCGVSPTRSPRLRPRPLPSSHRGLSGVEGHCHAGVREPGHPGPHRRRGPRGAGVLALEAAGSRAALGCGTPAVSAHTARGISAGPTVDPGKDPGQGPCGRPRAGSSNTFHPRGERGSENTEGRRPRPAPPPPRSPALANGPDSPRSSAAGPGPSRPAAQMPALRARPHAGTDYPLGLGAGHERVGGPGACPGVEGAQEGVREG